MGRVRVAETIAAHTTIAVRMPWVCNIVRVQKLLQFDQVGGAGQCACKPNHLVSKCTFLPKDRALAQ
jgi:hypothetical protein